MDLPAGSASDSGPIASTSPLTQALIPTRRGSTQVYAIQYGITINFFEEKDMADCNVAYLYMNDGHGNYHLNGSLTLNMSDCITDMRMTDLNGDGSRSDILLALQSEYHS